MSHAKYIGRIGALAVTLGVGAALGAVPGIAYADSGASTSDSSATSQQQDTASDGTRSAGGDNAERRRDRREARTEGRTPAQRAAQQRADAAADEVAEIDAPARRQARSIASEEPELRSAPGESAGKEATAPPPEAPGVSSVPATADEEAGARVASEPPTETAGTATTTTTLSVPQRRAPKAAPVRERTTLAGAVSSFVSALLSPTAAPGRGAPIQAPVMVAAMGAVRDELERNTERRLANEVAAQVNAQALSENVLVIGVDGVNLSRVLANAANMPNFIGLIGDATTAPASIVGHTTISNPSWTAILTGVWGERTGVINNVFTPWTYDKWPTVFDLIEGQNSAVQTTSIANWNVISAIADAGNGGADVVINVSQVADDPNWLLTDDAVGQATVAAVAGANLADPNFLFSYFVGVDENGHMYGGASEEYRIALENFDENLGAILQAINGSGEEWTILMVTDHGHQPQVGFGHGFQSPDETSTFVIARNSPLFTPGAMNLQYEIVDVTPTVLALFGLEAPDGLDGESLMDQGGTVVPVGGDPDEALREALLDTIDKYGYPDIGTQIALGARTVFGAIPYYVDQLTDTATAGLQAIVDMDIFLVSLLAKVAIAPVQLLGDVLYVATNIVAQIVARLTGVTGASIFPLWPPAPPPTEFTPPEPSDARIGAMCGSRSAALLLCSPGSVAV